MGRNKLLLDLEGKPILCHAVDQALGAGLSEIVVVSGHQAGKVRAALGERPVKVIEAREHLLGMSASLKAGIRALGPRTDAVLVMLGDMPQVSAPLIRHLIGAYNPLRAAASWCRRSTASAAIRCCSTGATSRRCSSWKAMSARAT